MSILVIYILVVRIGAYCINPIGWSLDIDVASIPHAAYTWSIVGIFRCSCLGISCFKNKFCWMEGEFETYQSVSFLLSGALYD